MTATIEAPQTANARLAAIVDDVVTAITDIIKKHRVTWDEYALATEWASVAGSTPYEIPMLLDVFIGTAVDDVNAAGEGTENNIEGPFYSPGAPRFDTPCVLPKRADIDGEKLVFSGTVRSTDGSPLAGATLDIWQANGAGQYSNFDPTVPEFNLRGQVSTDADGRFEFESVVPGAYGLMQESVVAKLLTAIGRPAVRPGHVHLKLSHDTAQTLTTQIYFAGDAYLDLDAVGAVKDDLVVKLERNGDDGATCSFDFVLPTRG